MAEEFQTALAHFPWAAVTLRCALPPEFAEVPDLPDRLHGAIGNRLRERPPGGDAELLYSLIYGPISAGEVPIRPVVLQADRSRNELTVRMHLAGTAANLMVTAAHALRAALTGGIRMGQEVRYRVMLDPGPAEYERHLGFADIAPSGANRLFLRLVTPLAMRMGKSRPVSAGTEMGREKVMLSPVGNLPWNIESRFRRMSAAFHIPVTAPSDIPRRLGDVLLLAEDRTYRHTYLHYSKSHRGAVEIPSIGGELIFAGRCHAFLPLLAFGRAFHAGSGAALGLGRIEYAAS